MENNCRKEERRMKRWTVLFCAIRKRPAPRDTRLTGILNWKKPKSHPGFEPSLPRQNPIALPRVPHLLPFGIVIIFTQVSSSFVQKMQQRVQIRNWPWFSNMTKRNPWLTSASLTWPGPNVRTSTSRWYLKLSGGNWKIRKFTGRKSKRHRLSGLELLKL